MKNKIKFLLAAMLVMALTVPLFTACREPEQPPAATTTTTTTTQPTTTAQPGDTTPPPPEPVSFPDLGGRVVRAATIEGGMFGWVGGSLSVDHEIPYPDPESGNYHRMRLMWDNARRVEEEFNIVIDPHRMVTADAQPLARLTTAFLAGEIYADIIDGGVGQVFQIMVAGYIQSLTNLANELPVELDFMTNQHWTWPWMEIDGHVWGIGRPLPVMNNHGLFVNFDIIEAFGAPNPVELYERGQWTWDAMREIMAMTTADTTGDGQIDTFGISGNLNDLIRHMIIANDAHMVDPVTLEFAYNTPETMAALDFVYDIIANGWWMPGDPDHEAPARGSAPNSRIWEEGRTALGIATASNIGHAVNAGTTENFTFMPFPLGPNNTSGHNYEGGGRNAVMIPRGVEDAHYMLWILQELFSWPGDEWYEMEFTADLEWARRFMPTEDGVQRIFNAGLHGRTSDLGSLAGLVGGLNNNMVDAWWRGEMTVAQSVEYWRQERQDAIDNFFSNWERMID